MATEPIVVQHSAVPAWRWSGRTWEIFCDYWKLTKPEINFLIAISTGTAFILGSPGGHVSLLGLLNSVLGTTFVASGTASLNQWIERNFDAQMRRTARRPVASGRIDAAHAMWFGVVLTLTGVVYLAVAANPLASLLALFTLASYLFLYTPFKRISPICMLIGAVPGAAPPLIGWAAAGGDLGSGAWLLFAVQFLWQFPHFMAIAWIYRDDYDRAGYHVLPQGLARNLLVMAQTLLPLAGLLGLFVYSVFAEHLFYGVGPALMSLAFLYYGAKFSWRKSTATARRLLLASILYIPAVFVWITVVRR